MHNKKIYKFERKSGLIAIALIAFLFRDKFILFSKTFLTIIKLLIRDLQFFKQQFNFAVLKSKHTYFNSSIFFNLCPLYAHGEERLYIYKYFQTYSRYIFATIYIFI